ncbi:MAG: hypothetical protein JJT89_07215 [Nitriliruptoraceae bacterium]|nr:hypothetical protein [Nitriliruptoraceae bacterium]
MSPEQYTAAATWLAALAGLGTLVVVIVTALYAKGQLEEARSLRLAQTRPFVVVSVDVEQQTMFMLVVENIGSVPAHNVRVEFDQMPHSSGRGFDELRLLKEPIPTMPPGHRYRAYWESALSVFDKEEPYEHPMVYRAEVTYENPEGHTYPTETYILDFRVYEGQAAGPKGMHDLVRAVETIHKQQKQWSQKGLHVRARNEDRAARRRVRPISIARALGEKDADGWVGFAREVVRGFRQRHGLYERPGVRKRKG